MLCRSIDMAYDLLSLWPSHLNATHSPFASRSFRTYSRAIVPCECCDLRSVRLAGNRTFCCGETSGGYMLVFNMHWIAYVFITVIIPYYPVCSVSLVPWCPNDLNHQNRNPKLARLCAIAHEPCSPRPDMTPKWAENAPRHPWSFAPNPSGPSRRKVLGRWWCLSPTVTGSKSFASKLRHVPLEAVRMTSYDQVGFGSQNLVPSCTPHSTRWFVIIPTFKKGHWG